MSKTYRTDPMELRLLRAAKKVGRVDHNHLDFGKEIEVRRYEKDEHGKILYEEKLVTVPKYTWKWDRDSEDPWATKTVRTEVTETRTVAVSYMETVAVHADSCTAHRLSEMRPAHRSEKGRSWVLADGTEATCYPDYGYAETGDSYYRNNPGKDGKLRHNRDARRAASIAARKAAKAARAGTVEDFFDEKLDYAPGTGKRFSCYCCGW